jgi:hypothetical protein
LTARPNPGGPSTLCARAKPREAARGDAAHDGAAHAGGARARRQKCNQAPKLSSNEATKPGIIPTLKGFARKPFRTTVFTTGRSSTRPRTLERRWPALAGHASHPGSLATRLAGRSATAASTPTLGGGKGVAELTELVATRSGHARRWRGRSGHPNPPRNHQSPLEHP